MSIIEKRRQEAIRYLILKGRTEEEAIAFYDRPRGVCECGAKCPKNGRQCEGCRRKYNTEWHQKNPRLVEKQCPVCLKAFTGKPNRVNCDEHRYVRARKHKAMKARVPIPRQQIRIATKAVDDCPVIVPPGIKVTVLPSAVPGRWD